MYHSALALIIKKGYFSKNHDATLCLLIQEYNKDILEEDLELINYTFLNNEDILFYAQAKNKREEASYSTKTMFDKTDTGMIFINTRLLFNKAKEILKD